MYDESLGYVRPDDPDSPAYLEAEAWVWFAASRPAVTGETIGYVAREADQMTTEFRERFGTKPAAG